MSEPGYANLRLDYFRSEFEGKLNSTRKELADQLAAANERIRQLDARVEKLVREMKNLEMSVGA